MELLYKRIANLLCIKSIVTLVLTFVFASLAVQRVITGAEFLTIFTVVIAFYFGSQSEKAKKDDVVKNDKF